MQRRMGPCSFSQHTPDTWCPAMNRCLRRSELGAAMGLPTHPALSCTYGMQHIFFEHLSRSAPGRLNRKRHDRALHRCCPCLVCGLLYPFTGEGAKVSALISIHGYGDGFRDRKSVRLNSTLHPPPSTLHPPPPLLHRARRCGASTHSVTTRPPRR